MNIITKFTLSSQPGLDVLHLLTQALAREKFAALLPRRTLDEYIARCFSKAALIAETNSMSNQWLVVYADDNPAGYARITSKGKRPQVLEGKQAVRIADFGILSSYTDLAVSNSLFEKCMAVCQPYEGIWINEYTANPLINFFESKGFIRQPDVLPLGELPLASVCLTA
ncbi:N-acetyltransferase [Chitinophaga parva]|uniref:N-acetyltransferase n=1 Tax=Chitinophaga parva TaxID=2169414 RepID=A0A2T7BBZ2_9BACT|nr:N-acetyltransferase [Chitinophaga parva]PUZ22599.1 N-acetyltransferase [Chitinophaga parva]